MLGNSSLHILTTLFDYYAFPQDAPGMGDRPGGSTPHDRVNHVEQALACRVGDRRFLPHLILHELETWVFAAAEQVGELLPDLTDRLRADTETASVPELVNDRPDTAPSKRIIRYCPQYSKTTDGPLAIAALGLEALRAQCPHLDAWLTIISDHYRLI